MNDAIRERPIDSVSNMVFWTVLSAVRNLDSKAVAAAISELSADHGAVLVNAVLEAVEMRLDRERQAFAAGRALPPSPTDITEQHGHA